MNDTNLSKILDGNYDNREKKVDTGNRFNQFTQRETDYDAMLGVRRIVEKRNTG